MAEAAWYGAWASWEGLPLALWTQRLFVQNLAPSGPEGRHLKGPMEPDLHGSYLGCREGDGNGSSAKWTAIFGHCERSFFFGEFREKRETRNVFDSGYFGVSNTP